MKKMFTLAAALLMLAAPMGVASVSPALAEGTPFCHSKAVNGETIDPPICNDARAHEAGDGNGAGQGLPSCKGTDKVYGCYW